MKIGKGGSTVFGEDLIDECHPSDFISLCGDGLCLSFTLSSLFLHSSGGVLPGLEFCVRWYAESVARSTPPPRIDQFSASAVVTRNVQLWCEGGQGGVSVSMPVATSRHTHRFYKGGNGG